MAYIDGRDLVRYHDRLADTCTADGCDARGVTVTGGSLRCIGHAIPLPVTLNG